MDLKALWQKLLIELSTFWIWLRQSSERLATAVVVAMTIGFCLLLVILPQQSASSSDEHGHGDHHDEELEGADEQSVDLDDDVLESAGMTIDVAAALTVKPHVTSRGQIIENANRSMNIRPRFSGIVKSVSKDFGDSVRKGETLLVIESAATRSIYAIRSAFDGIVADKRVVTGSFVPENESVFRVVDLTTVWFQTRMPISEALKIKSGFSAKITDHLLNTSGVGTVLYVSPIVDEDTQACDVRIELDNKDGKWRVGSFAEAEISIESVDLKIAVKTTAIQIMNDQNVIFKRVEDKIVAVPLKMGWHDADWSEVLEGVAVGDSYVSANSFIAKAELLKSTAEHEH